MGLIDIFKPLSIVLCSAVNKSQPHQVKNSGERQELNPGLLGAKRERFPLCYAVPKVRHLLFREPGFSWPQKLWLEKEEEEKTCSKQNLVFSSSTELKRTSDLWGGIMRVRWESGRRGKKVGKGVAASAAAFVLSNWKIMIYSDSMRRGIMNIAGKVSPQRERSILIEEMNNKLMVWSKNKRIFFSAITKSVIDTFYGKHISRKNVVRYQKACTFCGLKWSWTISAGLTCTRIEAI